IFDDGSCFISIMQYDPGVTIGRNIVEYNGVINHSLISYGKIGSSDHEVRADSATHGIGDQGVGTSGTLIFKNPISIIFMEHYDQGIPVFKSDIGSIGIVQFNAYIGVGSFTKN